VFSVASTNGLARGNHEFNPDKRCGWSDGSRYPASIVASSRVRSADADDLLPSTRGTTVSRTHFHTPDLVVALSIMALSHYITLTEPWLVPTAILSRTFFSPLTAACSSPPLPFLTPPPSLCHLFQACPYLAGREACLQLLAGPEGEEFLVPVDDFILPIACNAIDVFTHGCSEMVRDLCWFLVGFDSARVLLMAWACAFGITVWLG
jgi:hypothetical protein